MTTRESFLFFFNDCSFTSTNTYSWSHDQKLNQTDVASLVKPECAVSSFRALCGSPVGGDPR